MTIEDFVLYSDDQFESHLAGNGLYNHRFRSTLQFFFVFVSRHTASAPSTAGTHTGGVQ